MPTRKEISKTKQDFIQKKESAISSDIQKISDSMYESMLANLGDYKKTGKINKNDLIYVLKKAFKEKFPAVMRETASASKSLTDLNLMYFSTMIESNQLDEVKGKINQTIDKQLGLNPDGTLKARGFIDRSLNSESLQSDFLKELNNALIGNPDVEILKDRIKSFIVGNDLKDSLLERHYKTVASDLLITIDRKNGTMFAEQLGVRNFIFGGGLIRTSRTFCLHRNGKIFNNDQAEGWKNMLNKKGGPIWNENIDGKYIPTEQMGGYGCRHVPDWITSDLANEFRSENNKRATERNQKFREKMGLI